MILVKVRKLEGSRSSSRQQNMTDSDRSWLLEGLSGNTTETGDCVGGEEIGVEVEVEADQTSVHCWKEK